MAGTHFVGRLYSTIVDLNLDARDANFANYRSLIENGLMEEDLARDLLLAHEPEFRHAMDHPNPLRRPPTSDELYPDGPPDVQVGGVVQSDGVRFGVRGKDRPRNVLIAGNAGAGKTTLISNLIEGIHRNNEADPEHFTSLIICDKKGDYRSLLEQRGIPCLRLNVHDPGTKISLAAPEGVAPKAWFNVVASTFCALAGLIAAWTCLSSMMSWAFNALNSAGGSILRWPSLKLLLQLAKSLPLTTWAVKPDYEKSLINQLEAIVQSTEVFDCFGGLDIERDVIRPRRHLLLEMHNMAPAWVRQFLLSVLYLQTMTGRIGRHQKIQGTAAYFIGDEFDQDATAEVDDKFPDKMAPLSVMLRMGREYGIGTITGLGRLQEASRYVLSEAQYHFIFTQTDAWSMRTASSTLGLTRAADPLFPALKPGFCVARVAQAGWEHPMLVKVDERPTPTPPKSWDCDTHPIIQARDLNDLPEFRECIARLHLPKNTNAPAIMAPLSAAAHLLLHTAAAHPWAPAATLWRRSGKIPSPQKQLAVCRELFNAGLAESMQVRIGSANVLLYRITPQGWTYLGRSAPTHQGRGSIAHQHIAHWIAMCAMLDRCKSWVEWQEPGSLHAVDAAIQVETNLFDVFEVIAESEDVIGHLIKLSTSRFVRNITIVRTQKQLLKETQDSLRNESVVEELGPRLQWALAETFLRKAFP